MKKKLLIILVILLLIVFVVIIVKKSSKLQKRSDEFIPVYNADVVCSLSGVDNFEDEVEEYSLKAYLTLKDNLVIKAILVGVSTDTGNLVETQSIMNDYNKVSGINATATLNNDTLITEVVYDYEVIDLEEVKNNLGYLL
ncbi:MAG: hypothetical protein K2I70_06235, partial [Bacilli bacterium]|nr:hypothetical protein [Bacilli bacterium]